MSVKFVTVSSGVSASSAITPEGSKIALGAVVQGTATYTVQFTLDGTNWYDHATMAGKTANAFDSITFPVAGVRVNQTVGTGSVTLTALSVP